jgi:hypothetical protein
VHASLVVLDSLKDFSSKLSDDETGNRCNSAFQHVVADGRDILILHHVRKTGRQDLDRGVGLDDVYGSVWLFNGGGSVVYLDRGPADIELRQLKSRTAHSPRSDSS